MIMGLSFLISVYRSKAPNIEQDGLVCFIFVILQIYFKVQLTFFHDQLPRDWISHSILIVPHRQLVTDETAIEQYHSDFILTQFSFCLLFSFVFMYICTLANILSLAYPVSYLRAHIIPYHFVWCMNLIRTLKRVNSDPCCELVFYTYNMLAQTVIICIRLKQCPNWAMIFYHT